MDLNPFVYNFLAVEELTELVKNLHKLKTAITEIKLDDEELANKIKLYADLNKPIEDATKDLDITLSNYKDFIAATKTKALLLETIEDILNSSDTTLSNKNEGLALLYEVWADKTDAIVKELLDIEQNVDGNVEIKTLLADAELENI